MVAFPLFALTKKGKSFLWDRDSQLAFDKLKVTLTTATHNNKYLVHRLMGQLSYWIAMPLMQE